MSTTASGCFGANRILVAILLRQRDGGREAWIVADHARGVALTGRVLDQTRVAGAEDVLGAVAEADLELNLEDDHELAPRCGVPVDELTTRPLAERDLRRAQPLGPLRLLAQIEGLDVG